ncbi:thrombospondin type 3 repeat-containing protein [Tuberibacillus calidus]|uniref:thrombospondin type 3 repeat-containing protein n=1 Tax=Tuberibacillus calidus TaxID=340097 RepID=UPI00048246CB|nr:DUF1287 domain-containing protein [Tuberibacillus calidus]
MSKWSMRVLVAVLMVIVFSGGVCGYLVLFHGYHGSAKANAEAGVGEFTTDDVDGDGIPNLKDPDADGDGVPNAQDIVQAANRLVGVLYDPLKGGYGNIGGKMGFIVCIDVPRIAYAKAGIRLADLLTADFKRHPKHYNTENGGNTPETPYFFRRVRNVYDYAQGNGFLVKDSLQPRVGDIVFYGRYHATLVTKVYQNGYYDEIEADPKLIFVKKHVHKKWQPHDVARLIPLTS